MPNKSYLVWEQMKLWCVANPGKKGMIYRMDGDFIIEWRPKTAKGINLAALNDELNALEWDPPLRQTAISDDNHRNIPHHHHLSTDDDIAHRNAPACPRLGGPPAYLIH